jgi:hypothetical protein
VNKHKHEFLILSIGIHRQWAHRTTDALTGEVFYSYYSRSSEVIIARPTQMRIVVLGFRVLATLYKEKERKNEV